MANWPATLPQQLFLGASIGDEDSRLVTPMDTGPSTVRNRFTAFPQPVKTQMVLTGTQLVAFRTFYRTTLSNGSLSFTWTDPADDSSVTYRFKTPPVWTAIKSGPAASRRWQATLDLEILP